MKAVITGITGFAGLYLAEHLVAQGDEVIGVARKGWRESPPPQLAHVPCLAWDICDKQARDEAQQRFEAFAPDFIFHLAGISTPGDCGTDKPLPEAWAVNVEGVAQVAAVAASLPSQPKLFFCSTSHVYQPRRDTEPRSEDSPISPQSAYAQTKWAAERILRRAAEQLELPVIIARCFQNAGPRQSERLMLGSWTSQFARSPDAPVRVHSLDTWIDLTDVRDMVRAYRLLAVEGRVGETYNIGSGVARRTGDILMTLSRLAGRPRPLLETRPGTRFDPIADISCLRRDAGWQPEIPMDQTIADALAWWRAHEASLK